MRDLISSNIKSEVVGRWLNGDQRDKIASDLRLGSGTVTGIVAEWKKEIGIPDADTLRHFAIELRRLGITTSQCSLGSRLLNMIKRLGVDEESFESFANQVYIQCLNKKVAPHEIVEISSQVLALGGGGMIPISQLPQYINKNMTEQQSLEQELKALRNEKAHAQRERDEALKGSQLTIGAINEYIQTRDLLDEYGLSINNEAEMHKLVKMLQALKGCKYEPKIVTEKLSTIENLQAREDELQSNISVAGGRLNKINEECAQLEQSIVSHKMSLGLYNELERLGVGLKEQFH